MLVRPCISIYFHFMSVMTIITENHSDSHNDSDEFHTRDSCTYNDFPRLIIHKHRKNMYCLWRVIIHYRVWCKETRLRQNQHDKPLNVLSVYLCVYVRVCMHVCAWACLRASVRTCVGVCAHADPKLHQLFLQICCRNQKKDIHDTTINRFIHTNTSFIKERSGFLYSIEYRNRLC